MIKPNPCACEKCGIKFPKALIQTMFSTQGNWDVCAICALKIRNEIHGLNDKKFAGEMANRLLKATKRYLKLGGKTI